MASAPGKVLVMELAGLGDNVHLLPALWELRAHWPGAEIHVMVNSHVEALFRLAPWVDRTWGYPRPRPSLAGSLAWTRQLRAERFDCVINTTGSDRSSLIAWGTGAPMRIGRRPADGGPPGWAWLFTHVVDEPYYRDPMYVQKWNLMGAALLGPGRRFAGAPRFHVAIDASLRRAAGIAAADEGRYIHLSPCTTADERELPAAQLAALVDGLRRAFPQLRLALSCAGDAREQQRMEALLALLPQPPWKVFRGSLEVDVLAAVIEKAALAFSGDTGSLHLALMTGTPAVAWFRTHPGEREWIPREPQYRVLVTEGGARDALHGISTAALLAAAHELLAAGARDSMR